MDPNHGCKALDSCDVVQHEVNHRCATFPTSVYREKNRPQDKSHRAATTPLQWDGHGAQDGVTLYGVGIRTGDLGHGIELDVAL